MATKWPRSHAYPVFWLLVSCVDAEEWQKVRKAWEHSSHELRCVDKEGVEHNQPRTQAFSPQRLSLAVLPPALVLQATNAGVRKPGYEARGQPLIRLNSGSVEFLVHLQSTCMQTEEQKDGIGLGVNQGSPLQLMITLTKRVTWE